MKSSTYFIIFCGVITHTFADPSLIINGEDINDEDLEIIWDPVRTVTVNEFTDELLDNLDELLIADGTDPMSLPDVKKEINKKILFIHYKGTLLLTNISVSGLSTLQRSGDSLVTYDFNTNKARFDIPLKLDEVDFTCQFKEKLPIINSNGRLTGEMKNMNMVASIEIDFENRKASVLEYRVTDAGNIKVHIHVLIKIIDWLLDLLGDVATEVFKSTITNEVDHVVTNVMQKVVDVVNHLLSDSANVESVLRAASLSRHESYGIVNKS